MKNFGTLYRYELKKLLLRKLSWVTVVLLAVFCAYSVFSKGPATTMGGTLPVIDENGNEPEEFLYFSGEEIYATYLKSAGVLDGRVLDDELFQEMLENLPDLDDLELYVYFWTEDATYSNIYSILDGLFANPRNVTAEEFYAVQWERTQLYLDQQGVEREGLSEGEKEYWTEQTAKIEKPFVYRTHWQGTSALTNFFNILVAFLPVVAAVCVCMVFSEDRRTRMDALVFSTQESRLPLYLAKVLAGATTAALAGVVILGVTVAAHLAVWGVRGFDACIQMYMLELPRTITVGQMLLIMSVLLVLYTMLCGGITMLIAAITRNSIVALAVLALLVQILDRFRPGPYGWAGYLPNYLISRDGVRNAELVNIFGVYLNNFQFGPLLYLAITMLLLALCWLGWRRSAVGRI